VGKLQKVGTNSFRANTIANYTSRGPSRYRKIRSNYRDYRVMIMTSGWGLQHRPTSPSMSKMTKMTFSANLPELGELI